MSVRLLWLSMVSTTKHVFFINIYLYYTRALTPEECSLVQRLRDHTPLDDQDPDWVMTNDVLQGHETMDISHAGGENEALDDFCDNVNDAQMYVVPQM